MLIHLKEKHAPRVPPACLTKLKQRFAAIYRNIRLYTYVGNPFRARPWRDGDDIRGASYREGAADIPNCSPYPCHHRDQARKISACALFLPMYPPPATPFFRLHIFIEEFNVGAGPRAVVFLQITSKTASRWWQQAGLGRISPPERILSVISTIFM